LDSLEDMFGDRIDYCRSLVNIFSRRGGGQSSLPATGDTEVTQEVRMYAGQVLKKLFDKKYIRMSERDVESSDGIKERLQQTFLEAEPPVRKLCQQIMAKTLIKGGYLSWPELIDFFLTHLDKVDRCLKAYEGSSDSSTLTPEDNQRYLSIAENSIEAISVFVETFSKTPQTNEDEDESYYQIPKIVPHILKLLEPNHSEEIKQHAISIVNVILYTQAQVIGDKIENYMNFLIQKQMLEDPSIQVRWRIVQGITNIMDQRVDLIIPHISTVLDFMINALKEKDQKLALAATEFFSGVVQVVAGDEKMSQFVVMKIYHHLSEVCSLLLDCCKFTELDKLMDSNNMNEQQQDEDDPENIIPLTTLRKSAAFTLERFSSKNINFY
jgi:transportin-1